VSHFTTSILSYLLNSLWQAPLVFGVAWLATRWAREHGPAWVHRIWVTALCAQALMPLARIPPDRWQQLDWPTFWTASHASLQDSIQIIVGPSTPVMTGYLHLPLPVARGLELLFAALLLFGFFRLAWQLHGTYQLLRGSKAYPVQAAIEECLQHCRDQAGLAPDHVRLLTSPSVSGPVTAGIRRHAVIVPPDFFESLSTAECEAVLNHEFAHVCRHDFAKNLCYEMLALPYVWHPILWLTRTRLAESRELICDAMAARISGGPKQYAHSLLRLAAVQSRQRPISVHALGIFETHPLERRIMHLTQLHTQSTLARRILTLTACAALGLITCASALALHLNVPLPAHAMMSNANPVHVSPGVIAGNRISGEIPHYPAEAKAKHIQGDVILKAVISKKGSIKDLHAISGPPILRTSAIKAVRTWHYRPYLLNGEPVEVETEIHVIYHLGDSK